MRNSDAFTYARAEQALYTQFAEQFNRAMAEGSISAYEEARKLAPQLIGSGDVAIGSAAENMMEQLNWFPDAYGDKATGEQTGPEGYPYNYTYLGDSRELMKYVPDDSVNLIFTDPPYVKESMDLYGWLAEEADRVLTPDGFLMAYVGNYWKDNAMAQMREHMEYFWDYTINHGGDLPLQRNRNTRSATKSILCYRKLGSMAIPKETVISAFQGEKASKEYHPWGQPVDEAEYYIQCFSRPDELVLDPFMGGGTTAAACEQSGRSWIGFEKDSDHAHTAQQRIYSLERDRM